MNSQKIISISADLIELSKLFDDCGLYIVGGYVRNFFLSCGETDIDITSPLAPEEVENRLKNTEFKILSQYNNLRTMCIKSPIGEIYEYTGFRKDIYGKVGVHIPTEVFAVANIEEDALRRDFTINSIYYNINENKFCDPLNGIADAENKLLRVCSDETFKADGLRLMRLVRFAAQTGFDIQTDTYLSAALNKNLLKDIAPERITFELDLILTADKKYPSLTGGTYPHYRGIKLLKELGLLEIIIPEFKKCYGMYQRKDFHDFTVDEHIFLTVKHSGADTRLAALLHDIGKAATSNGKGNFYYHETVGADIAREILGQKRLKLSKKRIDEIYFLIRYHMYDIDGKTGENKIKWFMVNNFDYIEKLIDLKNADYLALTDAKNKPISDIAIKWQKIYESIKSSETPKSLKDLKIDGNEVLALNCPKNRIGDVLNVVFKECVYNKAVNSSKESQLNIALSEIRRLKEK